jgi:alpha-galactosidase
VTATKIACLGAGSLYFPRALGDLVVREDLAGSEIALYDLDFEKTELMAGMARRLGEEAGTGFTIRATSALADALDGAGFVITSIGGSGAEITANVYGSYYHAADMYIPAKYGIHQVIGDTAGPAGMMMGLRSVPVYLDICHEIEERCPDAVLLSHSNPMAVLCRAMKKYSGVKVIGICHGVQVTIHEAAEMLGVPADELDCLWIGTNHYYWIIRAVHRGVDLTGKLVQAASGLGSKGSDNLAHRLSAIHRCKFGYLGAGHMIEFYSWATRASSQAEMPYNLAAEAKAHGFDESKPMPRPEAPTPEVRRKFFEKYREILDGVRLPGPDKVDYVTEEGVARMISAILHGRREVFIVNVPNRGAVSNLPPEAVVEIEGVTDSCGVRGLTVGECPPVLKAILEKRFAWQELVVDAAAKGDRGLALQALMLDEMAIEPDRAEEMLDELLEASKDLLPQFFGGPPGRAGAR